MTRCIIHGGTVVTPTSTYRADIGIADETIVAVTQRLDADGAWADAEAIDATGKYVLPGAIDAHTHFQLPVRGTVSADDFLTGTQAAAAGGVTTFIDFATPEPGQSLPDAVETRKGEAEPKVCIDYSLHGVIAEFDEERFEEIGPLIDDGIPTFKMYMVYRKEGWMADDGAIYQALLATRRHEPRGMVLLHAENVFMIDRFIADAVAAGKLDCTMHSATRPNFTEAEAVARAINIAKYAGGDLYIVHLSTREALNLIKAARSEVSIQTETCPHFLMLTATHYARDDGVLFTTSPPVRSDADRAALWEGVANGTIDNVATDHCSFDRDQKATWGGDFRKIQFGLPGIEWSLPIVYSEGVAAGRFPITRLVECVSTNPARIFGLDHQKGAIQIGMDADIVILDPDGKTTLEAATQYTNIDYCPYEGLVLDGVVETTIARGEVIYSHGEVTAAPGRGRFIPRYRRNVP